MLPNMYLLGKAIKKLNENISCNQNPISGKGNPMYDAMTQLNKDHAIRQIQRIKTRAPITLVTVLIIAATVITGLLRVKAEDITTAVATFVVGGIIAALWYASAHLLTEWDRAIVLHMGRFSSVRGPGFFMIIPVIESVIRVVDMRVRTTTFYSEAMLTSDTVPVNIDAIAFWHVWDTQKALLEVESYYQAISLAVQTALRDIVGIHSLAEILSEREKVAKTLQKVLEAKTEAWGITVNSIEIRDIAIPEHLKDALSKQAQAERERQARGILGTAEMEIAEKFAMASKGYQENPVALQLRAMNIVYEGIRAGGSLMLIPSSVLDTMNLGGLAALGQIQHASSSQKTAVPLMPEKPKQL
jgi:regulator of protease activity HflC (stomatin/prohibitin superfamily)